VASHELSPSCQPQARGPLNDGPREARHPNIVIYLVFHEHRLQLTGFLLFQSLLRMVSIAHLLLNSLSRVTGNLRIDIYDKTKPFPWRLGVSFATDIARALAYLHARRIGT